MKTRIKIKNRKTIHDEDFNRITGKFRFSSAHFREKTYRYKVEYFITSEKRSIEIW